MCGFRHTNQLRATNNQEAGQAARAACMRSSMRRYWRSPRAVTNRSRSRPMADSMRSSMHGVGIAPVAARQVQAAAQHRIVGRAVAAMQAVGIERLVDQQRARHHLRHDDDVEIHVQAEGLVVVREDEVDQRAAEHHRRGADPHPVHHALGVEPVGRLLLPVAPTGRRCRAWARAPDRSGRRRGRDRRWRGPCRTSRRSPRSACPGRRSAVHCRR